MRIRPKRRNTEIGLDEIFLDSSNLSSFDTHRMEGRLELPLAKRSVVAIGVIFGLVALVFFVQLFKLQVVEGQSFAERSENNRLNTSLIFAERGVVYDRTGELLIWNKDDEGQVAEFAHRTYSDRRGLGQVMGYVNYPRKDSSGFYFRTEYVGRGGVEDAYNTELAGTNGEQFIEVDAVGNVISEHIVHTPTPGVSITLSIDAALSEALYDQIATTAAQVGFRSGAGAIMDIHTGEIVALASFPSYDPEILVVGEDTAAIEAYNNDDRLPFLNKIVAGAYTPGSVVKPFVALAALSEKIIDPRKIIVSTGSILIPNPYNPSLPSIFTDWRAHGEVDMRRAIAVSSNVYFYYVGGGFKDQVGLGITKLAQYFHTFGFGELTGVDLPGEVEGVVPDPEWKKKMFDDDWRLGDTYNTAIGQFGFQSTPLQILRAYAALANGGTLLTPTILKRESGEPVDAGVRVPIDPEHLRIVREGMRQSVLDGTARALNRSDVAFAGKTGTAELGSQKEFVNSWVTGYFPYEKPRYAFVLLMERGGRANLFGASPTMSQFFQWVATNKPEYLYEDLTSL